MNEFLHDSETSDEIQYQTRTVTAKHIKYEVANDQYDLQDRIKYLSPEKTVQPFWNKIYIWGGYLVQQETISQVSDNEEIIWV